MTEQEKLELTQEAVSVCFTPKGFRRTKPTKASGPARYIWRYLGFYLGATPALSCMPATADWELTDWLVEKIGPSPYRAGRYRDMTSEEYEEFVNKVFQPWSEKRKTLVRELDTLIDLILDTLPPASLKGVARWGRALGMLP